MARRSIEVAGLGHGQVPIPMASVVGSLLASGGIGPVDPATGRTPDDADAQVAQAFANVRLVVETAGGSVADIAKVTAFVADTSVRPLIDKHWTAMFPDPASRPARHVLPAAQPGGRLLQLEILAVLGEG